MSKYVPMFVWGDQTRALRGVCGSCDWHITETSIAAIRAHLLAHRDHIVAVVATVTTVVTVEAVEDQEVKQWARSLT